MSADFEDQLSTLSKPALRVSKDKEGASQLGGEPCVPANFSWPHHGEQPLTFVAGLDLSHIQAVQPTPWLPLEGKLLFFYDAQKKPWGFDPEEKEGWSVIHIPSSECALMQPEGLKALPLQTVSFEPMQSFPSALHERVKALGLDASQQESASKYLEKLRPRSPHHQVFGWAVSNHDPHMENECAMASAGIYCGDAKLLDHPDAIRARQGASDWRLLLTLDSDYSLSSIWGDVGSLFFWVREQDAAAGRFNEAWVVLQCN